MFNQNQGGNNIHIQNVNEEQQIIDQLITILQNANNNLPGGFYIFNMPHGGSYHRLTVHITPKYHDNNDEEDEEDGEDEEDEDHFNNNINSNHDQNDSDLGMIAEEMMNNLQHAQHVFTGCILTIIYGVIVLPLLEKAYSNAYSNIDDKDNNIKDQID